MKTSCIPTRRQLSKDSASESKLRLDHQMHHVVRNKTVIPRSRIHLDNRQPRPHRFHCIPPLTSATKDQDHLRFHTPTFSHITAYYTSRRPACKTPTVDSLLLEHALWSRRDQMFIVHVPLEQRSSGARCIRAAVPSGSAGAVIRF